MAALILTIISANWPYWQNLKAFINLTSCLSLNFTLFIFNCSGNALTTLNWQGDRQKQGEQSC